MAGSVQLYGNLVGLGAALATFAVLVVSYVFFVKKQFLRSDYLVGLILLNGCIFIYLIGYSLYVNDRSIVGS
jgi:hypothetical protein